MRLLTGEHLAEMSVLFAIDLHGRSQWSVNSVRSFIVRDALLCQLIVRFVDIVSRSG